MSLDSYINQNIQIDGLMQKKSSKLASQQLSYPSFALSQQNVDLLKSDKYKYSDKTYMISAKLFMSPMAMTNIVRLCWIQDALWTTKNYKGLSIFLKSYWKERYYNVQVSWYVLSPRFQLIFRPSYSIWVHIISRSNHVLYIWTQVHQS